MPAAPIAACQTEEIFMVKLAPLAKAASLAAALCLGAVPLVPAHDGHVHETEDVAAEGAPKILDFRVEKDASGGWNVFVVTENFVFAPESVNQPHMAGQGHAHLYINGTKLARLYGPVFHIEALPFGPHDMRIVLTTNDHHDYAIAGRPIEKTIEINVE
jgi:hypothetical protein